jgi:ribosome biogenesis GTPase
MAKRRLSQQQRKRIQQTQDAQTDNAEHETGQVISHQGGRLLVELDAGLNIECKIKSNLGSIVCGDFVTVETTSQGEHRAIAISPRHSLLQRVDALGQIRTLASNITQLVVCLAVAPEPNLYLLDQYLLSAEQQQIDACILLNKVDLCGDDKDPFQILEIYQPLGYPVIQTSVKSGQGMARFEKLLSTRISVISGVSGVGKSSLTSHLLPEEIIKIAELSSANEEGRHTTRSSRLYHLTGGGDLIDTPGVRGFSPFVDESKPLARGFREIQELASQCRFHNCLHLNEPRCAVIDAYKTGSINSSRYQSYLKMLEQNQ